MNFLRDNILKNLYYLNYLLIFSFFLFSIYVIRYQYDGHHIGLIYSNALDLINGKLPYKEIFIQYGFLTTLIHSIILLLFDNKVFFISLFNIIFYSSSIFLISKTVNNLVSKNYSIIATIIILFNHPIPWLPWSNYLSFFFISISLFLLSKNNRYFFLISFFLSLAILSRQDFFIPIVFSFLIFCIYYLINNKKIIFKNFFEIISGFFIPMIIFLLYLIDNNIFQYWLKYLVIPKYYLNIYEISLIDLINKYVIFFSFEAFFNFIYFPQYFIISIILIFNTILIFLIIFKKIKIPNHIFIIVLFSCLFSALGLKIELFRLYTSVIFGLIPLLYFFNKITNKDLKKNLNLLIILPSIFSFIFFPMGNNEQFKKINFNNNNEKIISNKFDYYIWPKLKINSINILSDLLNKCDVKYIDNLTFDTLLSTVGNFDRIRLLPYQTDQGKNSEFHSYIDSIKNVDFNFIELINKQIKLENIILLINENNDIYKDKKINISSSYSVIKINESDAIVKPKILRIYLPSKCLD